MLLLISINLGNYPIKQKPKKDSAVHIILLSILKHHNLSVHRGSENNKGPGLLLESWRKHDSTGSESTGSFPLRPCGMKNTNRFKKYTRGRSVNVY